MLKLRYGKLFTQNILYLIIDVNCMYFFIFNNYQKYEAYVNGGVCIDCIVCIAYMYTKSVYIDVALDITKSIGVRCSLYMYRCNSNHVTFLLKYANIAILLAV